MPATQVAYTATGDCPAVLGVTIVVAPSDPVKKSTEYPVGCLAGWFRRSRWEPFSACWRCPCWAA